MERYDKIDETKKSKVENTISDELERSLFVPEALQEHNLIIGASNMYYFMVYFYSIYERLCKAQNLIEKKVEKDLRDDFSHASLLDKFGEKRDSLVHERFQYLLQAIYSVYSMPVGLSTNEFEELSRQLLGNNAYLLFQMDKLISTCLKQLFFYSNDSASVASK